jgi:hypothetical protein
MNENEIEETYKILRKYALEQSSASDYITNYLDTILKYIAIRLCEDNKILCDRQSIYYEFSNTFNHYGDWKKYCQSIIKEMKKEWNLT